MTLLAIRVTVCVTPCVVVRAPFIALTGGVLSASPTLSLWRLDPPAPQAAAQVRHWPQASLDMAS